MNDAVIIVTVNPPTFDDKILGFRLFKDMFDRQDFHRISKYFSTTLTEPLTYTSDQIVVKDGDHLLQPNPGKNIPGVVYIDGERIEYLKKDGTVLSQLRRSTLGTGPALFSDIDTKVIDQSISQTIPTVYRSLVQHIPTSTTTTYIISTITNTTTFSVNTTTGAGTGIILSNLANAVDQVEVYYGGRRLRKTSLEVHDKSVSYYNSLESIIVHPPEFTITTSTRALTLNITEEIKAGTRITVIKREGELWEDTSSTSLLSSAGTQANFLRFRTADLPDIYFYGGDKMLTESSNALTDENGEPLEGY